MKRFLLSAAILSALSLPLLFAGCSSNSGYSSEAYASGAASSATPGSEMYAPSEAEAWESAAGEAVTGDEGSGLTETPLLAPDNDQGIELSYTVALRLQTTEFMAGIRTLNNTVAGVKGYTVQAHVQGRELFAPDYIRNASYVFKIPSARLSEFLMAMEDNFNLVYMEQSAEDITTRHQETDNRLEQLQEQEQRLREALAATEEEEARAQIESELRDTQRQIAELRADSADMSRQVLYSTVTVTLLEAIAPAEPPVIVEPTWNERLSEVSTNAGIRFLSMAQGTLLFLISALPVLATLGFLGLLAYLAYRVYRKVRQNKTAGEPKDDNQE